MIAIVGQNFDDEHRHQALAKVLVLGFLGAAMATAIGGVLAYFGSWRFGTPKIYLVSAVLLLTVGLISTVSAKNTASSNTH